LISRLRRVFLDGPRGLSTEPLTLAEQHVSGYQVWLQQLQHDGYNKEVDVFSLGVFLMDLLSDLAKERVPLAAPVHGVSYQKTRTRGHLRLCFLVAHRRPG